MKKKKKKSRWVQTVIILEVKSSQRQEHKQNSQYHHPSHLPLQVKEWEPNYVGLKPKFSIWIIEPTTIYQSRELVLLRCYEKD